MIATGSAAPRNRAVEALIVGIEKATGATGERSEGDTELLLKRLETGRLDLVIGRFDAKSPWATSVTIGPPLRIEKDGKVEFQIAPAMRNGENAWIALVERQARLVDGRS